MIHRMLAEVTASPNPDAVTRDLTRFSRRDPLTVNWHRADTSTATPAPIGVPGRRSRRGIALLVTAGVLAVAAHIVAVRCRLHSGRAWRLMPFSSSSW